MRMMDGKRERHVETFSEWRCWQRSTHHWGGDTAPYHCHQPHYEALKRRHATGQTMSECKKRGQIMKTSLISVDTSPPLSPHCWKERKFLQRDVLKNPWLGKLFSLLSHWNNLHNSSVCRNSKPNILWRNLQVACTLRQQSMRAAALSAGVKENGLFLLIMAHSGFDFYITFTDLLLQ